MPLQYCVLAHRPNAAKIVWSHPHHSEQDGQGYLVVETTLFLQKGKEFCVCFTTPKVQIAYLKVTPN